MASSSFQLAFCFGLFGNCLAHFGNGNFGHMHGGDIAETEVTVDTNDYLDFCPDANCFIFVDGSDYCHCDNLGKTAECVDYESNGDTYCAYCESNFVYYGFEYNGICGDPCWQERTCYPEEILCAEYCYDGCQCPDDKPIYDCTTNSCITRDECPSEDEWVTCATSATTTDTRTRTSSSTDEEDDHDSSSSSSSSSSSNNGRRNGGGYRSGGYRGHDSSDDSTAATETETETETNT